MKKFRFGVPLLLILLLAGSVYYMVGNRTAVIREYQKKLAQAREAVENGVITDGVALYTQALSIYPSIEIYTEVGNVYLEAEDLRGAKNWYEREFVKKYPNDPQAYEYGMRVSMASEDYRGIFQIYDTCTKKEALSDNIEQLIKPVWYAYELMFGDYDEVGSFSSSNGLAAVKKGGQWGYVDQDGKSELPFSYQLAGVFYDYAAVVDREGKAFYIDADGNTKITASLFVDAAGNPAGIRQFGPALDDQILAFDGTDWSYYSQKTYQKLYGGYKDATVVANGIGAVTKDGRLWALIGKNGQEVTGYDYEDIVTNGRGIACCTKGVFVQQNGKFWLMDTEGRFINHNAYDAVDGFYTDAWAAVQKNGKWMFVNDEGEEKDLGEFEEAKSFSNGLAAVKKNGMWGYIDLNGNQAIDCIFYEAEAFNSAGTAFVKPSEDKWNALSLYRLHFE